MQREHLRSSLLASLNVTKSCFVGCNHGTGRPVSITYSFSGCRSVHFGRHLPGSPNPRCPPLHCSCFCKVRVELTSCAFVFLTCCPQACFRPVCLSLHLSSRLCFLLSTWHPGLWVLPGGGRAEGELNYSALKK